MGPDLLGYVGAFLTTVAFIPQAAKTIRSRDTAAISLWTYVIFTTSIALWLVYGVVLGAWPIILSNVVVLPLAAVILAFKARYG
ncbi:SemiSWEET transporter [Bradyrhizobium sp. Arg314]